MDLSQQSTVMEILNKVQHADDWIILLEQLNQHFNLQASQLLAVDLEVQALSFSVHHGVDFDEHQLEQAALKQIRLDIDDDPRLNKMLVAPMQGWMHCFQHFTEDEILQTQVYQQVLKPLNLRFCSAIQILYDHKVCIILSFLTSPERGALSCSELQPIYELLPILQQKIQQYRHHFEYSTMTLLGSQLIQKMNQPIAIINLNGDILELNIEAKQLLENSKLIQIKQRRFAFNESSQQQFELNLIELERLHKRHHDLSYAERSKIMMIDDHLFLTLDLLSPEKTHKIFGLRPVLLATFSGLKHKPKYQREICTQLFMFTPVEHKICEQLLEGKTTKEIALSHDIQADTVKKHLQAIFKKTKTHRQSELIQLLMQFL
ncbi:helix-turn-helix transcriptional regulator [Acinetobacter sp. ANC5681]|jgi:DNA-binding CsgD family transcriptional regulator|uniref:helix-turn-helix transcriptional regulator n=1 Tax=Acinetobacter sp. ANC5681 TaxID=2929504 RepID=UPI00201ADDF5|nr:helix-turn-helix transcriptional regulator [Acinetobacter sp. ANC5681]MCL5767426.1 helix-turn-helix transcriptional regulator [Acinetobacter sp. ANC5681]